MKQIKITVPTVSAVYGRLGIGDVIRCGDAEAAEFVDQLRCAECVEPAGQSDGGGESTQPKD